MSVELIWRENMPNHKGKKKVNKKGNRLLGFGLAGKTAKAIAKRRKRNKRALDKIMKK